MGRTIDIGRTTGLSTIVFSSPFHWIKRPFNLLLASEWHIYPHC